MNYETVKLKKIYPDGSSAESERECLNEHMLSVTVNEQHIYSLVCTKDDLKELVYGRLFTDRIIDRAEDVKLFFLCKTEDAASVFLSGDRHFEETVQTDPSCCSRTRRFLDFSGKRELKALPETEVDFKKVFRLAEIFGDDKGLHAKTGAVHKCILSYTDGEGRESVKIFEDIGRHNTVDKAAGFILLNGIDAAGCMLFTSGRVPLDMSEKVIAAGIPVLISKSLPTADSVRLAGKYGLKLICRAWKDSCELAVT